MKTLLTLFLLLLAVATGEAAGQKEPSYPPTCWIQPYGQALWFPCGSEGESLDKGRIVGMASTPEEKIQQCYQRMEAAMRAMEPFIPHDHGAFMEQLTLKNIEPFKAASKQWEAVKRECWREP